jgi:hypothetical protein
VPIGDVTGPRTSGDERRRSVDRVGSLLRPVNRRGARTWPKAKLALITEVAAEAWG